MQQYTVTGMHCAACSASVEKAVKKVPGVTSCAVSLLTNSMGVEGTAEPAAVIKAVEDTGYGASVRGQEAAPAADASALEDRQTPHLKKRLIASVAFLLILMYFSMGHMMWGWPLPSWFDGNHVAMGLVQLLLAGIVMVINQEFFISGTKSLLRGSPNMDTLVSLGAAASFGWSVYALFAMTNAQLHGGSEAAMAYMDEFYFESAAMILTLITVGKLLEARSKGKTTDALKSLMKLAPKTAAVVRGGQEVTAQEVLALKPYSILVATGSNVISIPLEGLDQVQTVQAHDVLANDMQFANKKVVVIGGGITGLETALYINRQGTNQVSVVDMLPEWPVDMLDMRYQNEALLEVRHCNDQGVALFYNNKVVKFADGKLFIESTKDGEAKALPADVIVLSVGVKPNDALWQELLASGHPSVWKAGDAIATGKINKAVLHGSKFGYSLN